MQRRNFLAQLASGAMSAALGCGGSVFAYKDKKRHAPSPPPKLDRIAISTWSLHNYFRATRESTSNLRGPMLALLDFPEMIVDRYSVRHFEVCASQFPSTEQAFVRELKYSLANTLSTIVNISVDIEPCGPSGTFSDPDGETRLAALEAVKPWVDIAHDLGVKTVSVAPGKVDPDDLAPTVASYKSLATYALAKGVHVVAENQNSFGAEHPEALAKLIRLAGPGRLSALPNLANFPDEATRARGLKLLFPLAPALCHAKVREFDANGTESGYDFPQAVEAAKRFGFHGTYIIDFEGPGDPYAGIQKTLNELLEYL
jgi:hypothetical protein